MCTVKSSIVSTCGYRMDNKGYSDKRYRMFLFATLISNFCFFVSFYVKIQYSRILTMERYTVDQRERKFVITLVYAIWICARHQNKKEGTFSSFGWEYSGCWGSTAESTIVCSKLLTTFGHEQDFNMKNFEKWFMSTL